MALSNDSAHDDQQLVKYLLGLLPDDEAEHLDEATIVDDEVAARLQNVEDDLVDAYVSGALDEATRERFESYYMASPRRREKVRFARRFLHVVDRARPRETAAPTVVGAAARPAFQGTERIASRARSVWPLALAAALALTCGLATLGYLRLHDQLNDAQRVAVVMSERASQLTRQLEGERAANVEMQSELERARSVLSTRDVPAVSSDASAVVAQADRAGATLALVLLPQTRAPGPLPTIAISPATGRVALDLLLESRDFRRYQVVLKDPGTGRTLLRSGGLQPGSAGGRSFVSVAIPVALLTSPHHALEVAGLDPAGHAEIVGSYVFAVDRR
jgi:hypothetical protein